jgi:hypothetical protein
MKSATWQTARKEKAAWQNMLNRCRNPRTKDWKNYGGRGVVVCDRWRSWDAFICDVGFAPSPEHTLDRKDNDGNYEPGNVRWTLPSVQGLNRREQSHQAAYETKVERKGKHVGVWRVAVAAGIRPHLVYGRIRKGMTLAQALADATEALATARRP